MSSEWWEGKAFRQDGSDDHYVGACWARARRGNAKYKSIPDLRLPWLRAGAFPDKTSVTFVVGAFPLQGPFCSLFAQGLFRWPSRKSFG